MPNIQRSNKPEMGLNDPDKRYSTRPHDKNKKITTYTFAGIIATAMVAWIALISWGLFVAFRWLLLFLFSPL